MPESPRPEHGADPEDPEVADGSHAERDPAPPGELVEGVSRVIADYMDEQSRRATPAHMGRIDPGRELTHVLSQTADQLQLLQETQAQLAEAVGDRSQREMSLQSIKSLNFAFRELTEAQQALTAELGKQRRVAPLWIALAVMAATTLAVCGYALGGVRDILEQNRQDRVALTEDRGALADEVDRASRRLDRRNSELMEEIEGLSTAREEISGRQREEFESRITIMQQVHDEAIFQAESRLGDALREKESFATSQQALTDSLERVGDEMRDLREENDTLRLKVDTAEGQLAAIEERGDHPLPTKEEPISFEPPPGVEPTTMTVDPAPPPFETAPGGETIAAPARDESEVSPASSSGEPPAFSRVGLNGLVSEHTKDLGLVVVSARPGTEIGTFLDVVVEKRDGGRAMRRYSGASARLHLDPVRGKGIVRLSDGALTMFGWKGTKPFSTDIDFEEFDLQLDVTDQDAWRRSGATDMPSRALR